MPKGKNNGCICPSCDTPLIARHGEINEWHFAHESKNIYEDTSQKCEYSFFVSVRMMLRQLIDNSFSFKLPEYRDILEEPIAGFDENIVIPFVITPPKTITISNIEVETMFEGICFDYVGVVGDFKFMIFLSHEGREFPLGFSGKGRNNIGVIDISIQNLDIQLFRQKENKVPYKEVLLNFIKNELNNKFWHEHPRYNKAKKEAEISLDEFKEQFYVNDELKHREMYQFISSQGRLRKAGIIQKVLSSFKCSICKTEWRKSQSSKKDKLACPVCEP